MTTQELYNKIEEEISDDLAGQLNYSGMVLKWEYDGFNHLHNGLDEHLDLVAFEDKEILNEFLNNYNDFIITEPEIHDTFVYFYIEQ